MKFCRKCEIEKPRTSYNRKPDSKDKLQPYCKQCTSTLNNTSRRKRYDPLKNKDQMLKRDFGISLIEAQALLESQNHCCCICNMSITLDTNKTTLGKAHVDHDHVTGEVRGLLCSRCNVLLGMAVDNVNILANAIKYLNED